MRSARILTESSLRLFRTAWLRTGNCHVRRPSPTIRHLTTGRPLTSASFPFLRRWATSPPSPLLRHIRSRRGFASSPDPTPNLGSPEPSLSFSQRLRKLSREYGWSALGVYLALSALDFPFCFLAVRTLGTDRIGQWEHVVVQTFWKVVPWPFPSNAGHGRPREGGEPETPVEVAAKAEETGWGVELAEEANTASNASIWTQLALAYAIHKTFIFIRVPLTAAVTPKVVRVLRGWGWDIGKRKGKLPKPPTKE